MALLEIGPVAFGGTPGIIQYLRSHHLLAVQQNCSRCTVAMQEIVAMQERSRRDVSDGVSWWCESCKTRKSIITLQKWLLLLYFWAREYPVTTVAEDVGMEKSTACAVAA